MWSMLQIAKYQGAIDIDEDNVMTSNTVKDFGGYLCDNKIKWNQNLKYIYNYFQQEISMVGTIREFLYGPHNVTSMPPQK